jgi:hypothetical protein
MPLPLTFVHIYTLSNLKCILYAVISLTTRLNPTWLPLLLVMAFSIQRGVCLFRGQAQVKCFAWAYIHWLGSVLASFRQFLLFATPLFANLFWFVFFFAEEARCSKRRKLSKHLNFISPESQFPPEMWTISNGTRPRQAQVKETLGRLGLDSGLTWVTRANWVCLLVYSVL